MTSITESIEPNDLDDIRGFSRVVDVTDAAQSLLDAGHVVEFPVGLYGIRRLTLRDHTGLVGAGFHGDASGILKTSAAKIVLIGTDGGAGITSVPDSNLLYAGLRNLAIHAPAASSYASMVHLIEPIGCTISDVRMQTPAPAVNGLMTTKRATANSSWVNSITNLQVRLPSHYDGADNAARTLFTDMSDSTIYGGSFTGGGGAYLQGTGSVRVSDARFDHSKAFGLSIMKATDAQTAHKIAGCQIELNLMGDIRVSADADDSVNGQMCAPIIMGCQFRSATAPFAIRLYNDTGRVMKGGPVITGNVQCVPNRGLVSYDPSRWLDVVIHGNMVA